MFSGNLLLELPVKMPFVLAVFEHGLTNKLHLDKEHIQLIVNFRHKQIHFDHKYIQLIVDIRHNMHKQHIHLIVDLVTKQFHLDK